MQRSELVAELERLCAEATAAREQLEGILGAVTALGAKLPAAEPAAPAADDASAMQRPVD